MPMKTICRLTLVAALLLVAACGALTNPKDDLEQKNQDFLTRVRWLDFVGASLYFEPQYRDDLVDRFQDVEDLKVTAFSMTRFDVEVPGEKATIHYLLEYYRLPSATVQKKRFSLSWEQLQPGGSGRAYWQITEPFPELP